MQLRLKRSGEREAVRLARKVVALCRDRGAVCLINDRVDWALLSEAHGVHLGQDDLPVPEARQVLGPERFIGATVRNLRDIVRAKGEGADHVGLGPLFATATKEVSAVPLGLARLESITRRAPLPVVAIGGIGLPQMASVAEAGAHAAAVLSDLLGRQDIRAHARLLAEAFGEGWAARRI